MLSNVPGIHPVNGYGPHLGASKIDPCRPRAGRADSPSTSSTADSSSNRGDHDKTCSSDENHTPPDSPPSGTVFPAQMQPELMKPKVPVIVLPAPLSAPPSPPLSSVDEEESLQMKQNEGRQEHSTLQRQVLRTTIKAQVAQQAMNSTPTLVEAAENARQRALATAEAMAERRRCGAAGATSKSRRAKHQHIANRSRSLGVSKVNEAQETSARAASVERSVAVDSDSALTSKGVPGIWDSALKLIHSVKTCKDAKKEADEINPSTGVAAEATETTVPQSRESTQAFHFPSKAYRNRDSVLGMLKMVQSDFAQLEAKTKCAMEEAKKEVKTNAGTRASHTSASSADREDSFERWRKELRAQAGLDESDLDCSLKRLIRDPLAGTI